MVRRPKRRAIARIQEEAEERAHQVASFIHQRIRELAPYDSTRRGDRRGPRHLRNSYYVEVDPITGDYLIKATKRYWVYVEFGTAEHGDAQPHVRPAIEEARARYG
ncbi:MAG: HK97 gp10 family phage protein [Actinoplanes sp.]